MSIEKSIEKINAFLENDILNKQFDNLYAKNKIKDFVYEVNRKKSKNQELVKSFAFQKDKIEKSISDLIKKVSSVEKIQTGVELLDVYTWKWVEDWKRSITIRFSYWLMDWTLKDDQVNSAHENVLLKAWKVWLETRI